MLAQLAAASGRSLHLSSEQSLRLTLRDAQGVRLLDVHAEAGTALELRLPANKGLTAEELVTRAERPSYIERAVPDGSQLLGALPIQPLQQSPRGESPLFQSLFAAPFGKHAVIAAGPRARAPGLADRRKRT